MADGARHHPSWTFLTNHARVLLMLSRDPGIRLRDVAAECGVTERTVQAIVADLEADGYVTRTRGSDGRRNRYEINAEAQFRHPAEAGHEIAGLLALLSAPPTEATSTPSGRTPATAGRGHGGPDPRRAARRHGPAE
ncbi:helix-turn-helix transcriptional regulator [Streptomyces sp. NBC_01353]|uniref:helix-turn-helix transcriptional regulator n=1 Tax=Streptomyces sp. NBC_01353 TaxID=2903835 RepID=UPI002E34B112|nr:helix-turn-helix domain-containing protein [Streptomyces sp. NBC_01353]